MPANSAAWTLHSVRCIPEQPTGRNALLRMIVPRGGRRLKQFAAASIVARYQFMGLVMTRINDVRRKLRIC